MPPKLLPARYGVTLAVLLLSGGCQRHNAAVTKITREEAVLSEWKPPVGQKCEVAAAPSVLPDVATLIDTTAMPAYLEQGGISSATGSTLFSIKFDSAGQPVRARVIESTMPERLSSTLQSAVASAIQAQTPGGSWGVRVRIEMGPALRYKVGRSETCPPVLNYNGTYAAVPPHPGDISERVVDKRIQEVRFNVLVAADGTVLAAKLATGIGNPDFEASMQKFVMAEHWKPGLDDQMPVTMSAVRTERITSETRIKRVM